MIVTEDTDISVFTARRVRINGGQHARVHKIRHGVEATRQVEALSGGVWGDCHYERHHNDPGGSSSFWWPYGTDLTVTN